VRPDPSLDCAASDAMTNRLAEVISTGEVPRLALASPSLAALDACAVVRAAGIVAQPDFADGEITAQGFGASCEVHRKDLFLFVNFVRADAVRPAHATPTTVAGHQLYATSTESGFCGYLSTQGATPDGKYEQLSMAATSSGSSVPPDLCDETAQALGAYLSAAGLS
jgi:hypothetical protein